MLDSILSENVTWKNIWQAILVKTVRQLYKCWYETVSNENAQKGRWEGTNKKNGCLNRPPIIKLQYEQLKVHSASMQLVRHIQPHVQSQV